MAPGLVSCDHESSCRGSSRRKHDSHEWNVSEVIKCNKKEKRYRLFKRYEFGRFQVSLLLTNEWYSPMADQYVYGPVDMLRACIRYNDFDHVTGRPVRRFIWCSPDELDDLETALRGLRENRE